MLHKVSKKGPPIAEHRFSFNKQPLPNYERDVDELTQELLNFCMKANHQKCQRDSVNNNTTKYHESTFVSTYRQPHNPQDDPSHLSPETGQNQSRRHATYNEYFSQKRSGTSTPRIKGFSNPVHKQSPLGLHQIKKVQAFTHFSPPDKESVLDDFLREQKTMIAELISQEASKNADRSSVSPYKSIRKTQTYDPNRSKSPRNYVATENKSPQRLSIQKVSDISIKAVTPFGLIKHNHSMEMPSKTPKAIKKQNINSSRSVIMVTQSQYVPPSELKYIAQDTSNVLDTINKQKQKQINKNESLFSRYVVPEHKSSKKKDIVKHLQIQIDLPQLIQIESSKTDHYNYDDSEHIFDKIQKVPIKEIKSEQIQSYFHIRDKNKFQKQVEKNSQSFKQKQKIKIQSRRQQDKIKVFDGCAELIYKKKQEASEIKIPILEPMKDTSSQHQQEEAEQSFHFFNFLKDKIISLTKQGEPKKDVQSAIQLTNQAQVQNIPSQTKQILVQKYQERSMHNQPSNQSSNSSFFKEKMLIEQKGVRNIDLTDLIGQTVKRVSVNLEKASQNMKKNKVQSELQRSRQKKQEEKISNKYSVKSQQLPKMNKTFNNSIENKNKGSLSLKNQNQQYNKKEPQIVQMPNNQEAINFNQERYNRIFGNQKNKKQQNPLHQQVDQRSSEINQSSQFFQKAACEERDSRQVSHPSTVQKAQSHSADKSLLNQLNFEQIKNDDSMIANLFQKNEPESKSENNCLSQELQKQSQKEEENKLMIKKSQTHNKPEQSKNISMNFSISHEQNRQQKPKQININLADFPSISLSQDVISYSKLESVTEQQEATPEPTLNSFKIDVKNKSESKSKNQEQFKIKSLKVSEIQNSEANSNSNKPKQRNQQVEKAQKKIEPDVTSSKKGKVRKIDINLQDSSDDSFSSILDDSEDKGDVDVSDLNDYDSDQEEPTNPARVSTHQKIKQKISLFPVFQEEMEQSEMFRNKKSILNSYPIISSKGDYHPKEEKQDIRQLQEEFLKDFNMEKKESEVQLYKCPIKFDKKNSQDTKERKIPIKKIKLKQTDSNIMNSKNQESSHSESIIKQTIKNQENDREQKQFIDDIKGDLENLKKKISESFNLDLSKQSIKSIPRKISSKHNKNSSKNINIDLSDDLSGFNNYSQDSTIKRLRQGSNFNKYQIPNRESIQSGQKLGQKKMIDFEEINSASKDNLFSSFKEDLKSLKKKMEKDILK